uniref:VM domain-containing protein n=1 Tax=Stomoxys calcitrans TaxID=35570 RepID=A0A1I8P4Q4_STOCA
MKLFALNVIAVLYLCSFVAADNDTDMQERAYGGGAPSYGSPAAPSYSAPAAPAYSAPAASSYSAPAAPVSYSAPASPAYSAPAPAVPSYSAPMTIPAPPCPKNYLFSCQPTLTPAPCSAAAAYGNAAAYSQNYPVYAIPQYVNAYRRF